MIDFLWFLSSTSVRAGFIPFFIIILCILCVVIVVGSFGRRRGDYPRENIPFLLALSVMPILIGLWGRWWWIRNGTPNPDWVEYPVALGVLFELVLSVWLVWRLRRMRLFTAAFSVMNLYFALWMAFFALMFINRDYWHLGMS
jgi:hypothetical protein